MKMGNQFSTKLNLYTIIFFLISLLYSCEKDKSQEFIFYTHDFISGGEFIRIEIDGVDIGAIYQQTPYIPECNNYDPYSVVIVNLEEGTHKVVAKQVLYSANGENIWEFQVTTKRGRCQIISL